MPAIGETYNPYLMYSGAFVPNWLLERPEVGHPAKLLYGRLQQLAGARGTCCATHAELARDLGVKEGRINGYLNQLGKYGLIERSRAGSDRGTCFRFVWNAWAEAAPRRLSPPRSAAPAAPEPRLPGEPFSRDSRNSGVHDPRKSGTHTPSEPRKSEGQTALDLRKSEGQTAANPRFSGTQTTSDSRKSGSQVAPAADPRKNGSQALPEPRPESRNSGGREPRNSAGIPYSKYPFSEESEKEGEGTQYPAAALPEEPFQPTPDLDPFRSWDDPLPGPVPDREASATSPASAHAFFPGASPRAGAVFQELVPEFHAAIGHASPSGDRKLLAAIEGWLGRGETVRVADLHAAAEDARKFQGRSRGTVSVDCFLIGLDRAVNARLQAPPPPDPVQEAELQAAEAERAARLRAAEEARQAAAEAQRRHLEAQHALIRRLFPLPSDHPDWSLVPPAVAVELQRERQYLRSRGVQV